MRQDKTDDTDKRDRHSSKYINLSKKLGKDEHLLLHFIFCRTTKIASIAYSRRQ